MQKCVIFLAAVWLMSQAAPAEAQWPSKWPSPFDGRLMISINGGGQVGSNDVVARFTAPRYEQLDVIDAVHAIRGGGFFDIGARYPIRGRLGAGIAYSRLGSSGATALSGIIPHPLSRTRPRHFEITGGGLGHREESVHFQAVYFLPFTEKIDFAFALGPSFFSVRQEFARGIFFEEIPPEFDAISITSLDVVRTRRSGAGINISGDMTYAITEKIGAGLLLRFTRGGVDFDLGDGQRVDLNPGHFQAAVGARLRF